MKKYLPMLLASSLLFIGGCQVITGRQTAEQYSSDAAITANIKTELLNAKPIASLPIHVKTQNGVVTLSGVVRTSEQKMFADQAAHRVKEAQVVINKLIVRKELAK